MPREEYVKEFYIAGSTVRTHNEIEVQKETLDVPESAKIPMLWEQFKSECGSHNALVPSGDQAAYAVYSDYESDTSGHYDATVGSRANGACGDRPRVKVKAGRYLVFQGQGVMPETMYKTWSVIWSYFEEQSDVRRQYGTDFEKYLSPEMVEIYVGIVET